VALYREQGIVLRRYPLGEADRIVVLLTPNSGKIRAVAKGARRTKSRFGARLEPFSHTDAQFATGKSLDVVTQTSLITAYDAVRSDYARSVAGQAMAEACDRAAPEAERAASLFVLLRDGLARLADLGTPASEVARVFDAFHLRLASVAGYHAHLEACAVCGVPGRHPRFAFAAGGCVCEACAPLSAEPLGEEVHAGLLALADSDWGAAAPAATRTRRAVGALVSSYVEYHLETELKAAAQLPR